MEETELTGGNMSGRVVRVGDTVRKPADSTTPTIHRLLAHVRGHGLDWVPEPLGIDDQGRQVLRFIEGDVGHGEPSYLRDLSVLKDVAIAARQWHDATVDFPFTGDEVWFWQPGQEPHEVITHNDFAPYNHVFVDGRFVGVIDCDIAYPAYRLWDLAWTAYRYVPLTPHVNVTVDDGEGADRSPFGMAQARERLRAFLEAYGPLALPDGERSYEPSELLEALPERLEAIASWASQQDGDDFRRWAWMYRAHARWIANGGLSGP